MSNATPQAPPVRGRNRPQASRPSKCGATTGPSAEDWEKHRAIIAYLYHKHSWKEMDKIMRTRYDFIASKRMYNQRFRQWGISKYLSNHQKTDILQWCGGNLRLLTIARQQGRVTERDYKKMVRWVRANQPSYPVRSMSHDPNVLNLEAITQSLQSWYHWLADAESAGGPLMHSIMDLEASKESNEFWYGLMVGKTLQTYEDDVGKHHWAYGIFRQAGELAAPAMISQPLDFICNLFVELSLLNAQRWPRIREIILQLLSKEASRCFRFSTHPIAIICGELQKSQGSTDVSRVALQCMLDLVVRLFGSRHTLNFKIQKFILALMLKARNMAEANKTAHTLRFTSEQLWGPKSEQARMAEFRLGQVAGFENRVLASTVAGPRPEIYEAALDHFHKVINWRFDGSGSGSSPPGIYPDETSLSTIADIAMIHQARGELADAALWLEKAIDLADHISGPDSNMSRMVMVELTPLYRRLHRDADVMRLEERMSRFQTEVTA